jgi:hypothetical protein
LSLLFKCCNDYNRLIHHPAIQKVNDVETQPVLLLFRFLYHACEASTSSTRHAPFKHSRYTIYW